jgi:hypothetical protein
MKSILFLALVFTMNIFVVQAQTFSSSDVKLRRDKKDEQIDRAVVKLNIIKNIISLDLQGIGDYTFNITNTREGSLGTGDFYTIYQTDENAAFYINKDNSKIFIMLTPEISISMTKVIKKK